MPALCVRCQTLERSLSPAFWKQWHIGPRRSSHRSVRAHSGRRTETSVGTLSKLSNQDRLPRPEKLTPEIVHLEHRQRSTARVSTAYRLPASRQEGLPHPRPINGRLCPLPDDQENETYLMCLRDIPAGPLYPQMRPQQKRRQSKQSIPQQITPLPKALRQWRCLIDQYADIRESPPIFISQRRCTPEEVV